MLYQLSTIAMFGSESNPLPISFPLLSEDLLEVLLAGQSLIHHTGTLLSSLMALKSEVKKLTINNFYCNNILTMGGNWKIGNYSGDYRNSHAPIG